MFQKEFDNDVFTCLFYREKAGENLVEKLKNFATNKKMFFFSGIDFGQKKNLVRLYKELIMFFENKKEDIQEVTLKNIFDYIKKQAVSEKIVWVFYQSEFIFEPNDFSELETFLKEMKNTNNLMLCVTTSASYENKVSESKLSKYIYIPENPQTFYSFWDSKTLSAEDKFKYYAIFGNCEKYLSNVNFSQDLRQNIIQNFFSSDGNLFSETKRILKSELREVQVYNIILEAISKGHTTLNEISDYVGLPTGICNKYTTVLLSLNILRKIKPVFGKDTRKSKYEITNRAMDFWFYFVPENITDITLNKGEWVYDTKVYDEMYRYLQLKFPLLCREYLAQQKEAGKITSEIRENGIWWDKDCTIDIVAGNGLEAIVGDCYWNNEPVGRNEFEKLLKKANHVDLIDRYYYLFSKVGFTEELKRLALERKDLTLISFSEMVQEQKQEEKTKKRGFFFSRK